MPLIPKDQGLYEARREHDACGIGAVVNISGKKEHSIILENLSNVIVILDCTNGIMLNFKKMRMFVIL